VPKSAPSERSRRSEEISVTVGASVSPLSRWGYLNHRPSRESRAADRRYTSRSGK
jgi:hypothetical protein